MPKGACEESCCFGAARWVWTSWLPDASVVAEEGSVAKHIPATTDVHGVPEISQRWADHVHREVALEATFPLRARHKAFNPWQLSKTHSGKEKLRNFPLKFEWKRLDSDYTSVKSEIQFGVHCKKKKEGKIEKPGQRGERTEICGRSVSRECVYNQFSIQSQPAIHPLPAPGVLLHLHSKMPKFHPLSPLIHRCFCPKWPNVLLLRNCRFRWWQNNKDKRQTTLPLVTSAWEYKADWVVIQQIKKRKSLHSWKDTQLSNSCLKTINQAGFYSAFT